MKIADAITYCLQYHKINSRERGRGKGDGSISFVDGAFVDATAMKGKSIEKGIEMFQEKAVVRKFRTTALCAGIVAQHFGKAITG